MSAQLSNSMVGESVRGVIYESCLLMNEEDWPGFLNLCDPQTFRYSIVNYCPEIRKEQCWMERDHKGLKHLFELLPKHNSDHSQLTRHATVYRISYDDAVGEASAVSQVSIYRTQLDGVNSPFESGLTSLYAVGRYLDKIRIDGNDTTLTTRVVRLDTRQLDIGSHYPF